MEGKDWILLLGIICSIGVSIFSAYNLRKLQDRRRNDEIDLKAFSHSLESKIEDFKTSLMEQRSYLTEKGRNAATKESVEELTRKVESIKNEFVSTSEILKSELSKRANLHKLQAEKEFEIYSVIWDKAVDLKYSVESLRPAYEEVDPSKSDKDKWNERYRIARNSISELRKLIDKKRPFYPDLIFKQLISLINDSWTEIVDFEFSLNNETWKMPFDGYKRGRENVNKVIDNLDQVCDLMRKRISDT